MNGIDQISYPLEDSYVMGNHVFIQSLSLANKLKGFICGFYKQGY